MHPHLAATVLLVRHDPAGSGAPQFFMVRRHGGNEFMPNAHVFVGGKLDAGDSAPQTIERCRHLAAPAAARRLGLDDERLAIGLYVAALRETFEESGLFIGETDDGGAPDPALLAALRHQLVQQPRQQRGPLGEVLASAGLWLDPGRLRYLAHWVTPPVRTLRFDAHFFVCPAPPGQRASHDERETTAGGWFTISELLAANRAERLQLPPPTLCVLEDLQRARDLDQVLAAAADVPQAPRQPRLLPADPPILLLPEDHRYDDPASRGGREHYVVLRGRHWERVSHELP